MALTFENEIVQFRFYQSKRKYLFDKKEQKMAGLKREHGNETAGFPSVKKPRRFSMRYVLYICYSKFWYQKLQGTACM